MTTAQKMAPAGTRHPGLLMVEAFTVARSRGILTGKPDVDRDIVAALMDAPDIQKKHAKRMAAVDETKRWFMAGPAAAGGAA